MKVTHKNACNGNISKDEKISIAILALKSKEHLKYPVKMKFEDKFDCDVDMGLN